MEIRETKLFKILSEAFPEIGESDMVEIVNSLLIKCYEENRPAFEILNEGLR